MLGAGFEALAGQATAEPEMDPEAEAQADAQLDREIEEAEKTAPKTEETNKRKKQPGWKIGGVRQEVHKLEVPQAEKTCEECGREKAMTGTWCSAMRLREKVRPAPGSSLRVARATSRPTPPMSSIGCHARRKMVALQDMDCRVAYPLKLIARLYRIEHLADARELTPEARAELRQERSLPVLEKLKRWLLTTSKSEPQVRISRRPRLTL